MKSSILPVVGLVFLMSGCESLDTEMLSALLQDGSIDQEERARICNKTPSPFEQDTFYKAVVRVGWSPVRQGASVLCKTLYMLDKNQVVVVLAETGNHYMIEYQAAGKEKKFYGWVAKKNIKLGEGYFNPYRKEKLAKDSGYRENIREAQKKLNSLGYSAGPADGIAGKNTSRAIKSFQADNQMVETGELDEETFVIIKTLSAAGNNKGSSGVQGNTLVLKFNDEEDRLFQKSAKKANKTMPKYISGLLQNDIPKFSTNSKGSYTNNRLELVLSSSDLDLLKTGARSVKQSTAIYAQNLLSGHVEKLLIADLTE